MIDRFKNVDALEGLKQLPDECVDCVITSPPYWQVDLWRKLEKDYEEKLCSQKP